MMVTSRSIIGKHATCNCYHAYSSEPRIEHAGAFLREWLPREIALSLLRARRFPRNLGFTNQLDTVQMQHDYSLQEVEELLDGAV